MKHLLNTALYVLVFWTASGQDVSFSAHVNRKTVPVGSTFKLIYEINTTNGRFEYPRFSDDFQVVSGPNKSTSMQIINGSMSSSMSISYILVPLKEGHFNLPTAKVHIGNATYETQESSITVTKGNGNATQNSTQSGNKSTETGSGGNRVFIKLITDRSTAYIGEPICATYKLYWLANEVQIMDYDFNQLPAPKGFWSEEVKLNQSARPKLEIIDGKRYNTYVMKKVILFPQYSGKLSIDPFSFSLMLRVVDRSAPRTIWDQLMGRYKDIRKSVKSNTAQVLVKDFPANNKPTGFNKLCGSFHMQYDVPDSTIKTDEAQSIRLHITGSGNLNLISPPEIAFPPDFETYEPKVTRKINVNSSGVSGTINIEYLFIPRVSGTFTIPTIDIPYFQPGSKSYKHLVMKEIPLNVTGSTGEEVSHNSLQAPLKHEIKAIGTDIRHIVTKSTLDEPHKARWLGIGHIAGLCLPLLLLALYIPVRKRVRDRLADTAGRRKRKADKVASSRLKMARLYLKQQKHERVVEAISLAIMGYLRDKLQINLAELNRDNITEKLEEQDVSKEHIHVVISLLDDCEIARFSQDKTNNSSKLYGQAANTIAQLEKIL